MAYIGMQCVRQVKNEYVNSYLVKRDIVVLRKLGRGLSLVLPKSVDDDLLSVLLKISFRRVQYELNSPKENNNLIIIFFIIKLFFLY